MIVFPASACYHSAMTGKELITNILLIIMIAFIAFNFYMTISLKKKRKTSEDSYRKEMDAIEDNLIKLMKERSLNFTTVRHFMNDRSQGIIFVSDPEKRKAAIGMREDTAFFSFDELEDAGKIYEEDGKGKIQSAKIFAVIDGTRYEYDIATKPFRKNGMFGKVIYKTAEDFAGELEKILKEKTASPEC